MAVILIAQASPVSAAPANLLGNHGNFEKPRVHEIQQSFAPGSTFDGWQVSAASVSLGTAFAGVMVPPQGKQALVLNDAGGVGGEPTGLVCRAIPTVAGDRYKVTFLAAVVNAGSARIVVSLGSASAKVQAPPGGTPANFESFHVELLAGAADASFCFTATKVSPGAFPVVDAAKVVELRV